jgi:hypothetical protein
VSHGDSLNYESVLDKFSSVSSFKETPVPPSAKELGDRKGGGVAAGASTGPSQLPLAAYILGKVTGCSDQRMTPRIKVVKVCPQTKGKDDEPTQMDFK